MVGVLSGLISDQALDDEYKRRSLDHLELVVTAKSAEALAQKVEIELSEGWLTKKLLKRRAVLKRSKDSDVWVEDRLWSLFKILGFEELNKDRAFMITEAGQTKRQVDIFAKDAETVFVVECTHLKQAGSRSLKPQIDKINSYRQDVINAITRHYGHEPKLKVKFAICTSNLVWNEEDKKRAEAGKIACITEEDIKYYEELYKLIRGAAKYQFLGRYLSGERVEGLQLTLPATRGKAGGGTFYSFLISPHDLLRIGYINHRTNGGSGDLHTYQRMVKASRLKEIGQFLDDGGKFPTNIIVNFKTEGGLRFENQERFGDTAVGRLTLPPLFGCAWIIDGQHRLYGYGFTSRSKEEDHSVVSVLAYEGLPIEEEIQMFVDINHQQVKIKGSLVDEIISSLNTEDEDPARRLAALSANLALRLNKLPTSPLRNRIGITGTTKSTKCCITPVSISTQARSANLLGRVRGSKARKELEYGPLSDASGSSQKILGKSVEVLSKYFKLFSNGLEAHWELGDAKGGYICTNNGLRPLIVLLAKIIDFVEARQHVRARDMDADEIIEVVAPYVEPLIEYFQNADPTMVEAFRNRGSSLKTVDDNCFQMMAIINDSISDFTTRDLEEYKSKRDVEGTRDAKRWIDEINTIVFANVIATLQDKYGPNESEWWMQGVPTPVRNRCDTAYNNTGGKSERWRQLSLSDYPDIVGWSKNWDEFKKLYNFNGRGSKAAAISWIIRINKAKAVADHAERGPLEREDVDFVRRVHDLVKTHIEGETEVDGKTSYLAAAPGTDVEFANVA